MKRGFIRSDPGLVKNQPSGLFQVARLNLELGYSIALDSKPYRLDDNDPSRELPEMTEDILNFMTPGGLILGMGVTFGIQ